MRLLQNLEKEIDRHVETRPAPAPKPRARAHSVSLLFLKPIRIDQLAPSQALAAALAVDAAPKQKKGCATKAMGALHAFTSPPRYLQKSRALDCLL